MNNKKGFTLIEVLIALAIISIAFTAIILSSSRNIRNTQYLESKMIAIWVGANIINEIRAGVLVLTDTIDIKTDMLGHEWSSKAELRPTKNPKIQLITVRVTHQPDDKEMANMVSYASQ